MQNARNSRIVPKLPQHKLLGCETEPIHVLGRIQSRGFLLGVEKLTGTITHVSENLAHFFPLKADEMLGKKIKMLEPYFLSPGFKLTTYFKKIIAQDIQKSVSPPEVILNKKVYYLLHFVTEDTMVFELEPVLSNSAQSEKVSEILADILNQSSLTDIMQCAVKQIKSLIGFNRVLVYQFMADGSGEVKAETSDKKDHPFLGLRFPESDIPSQARALYTINHERLIHHVGAKTYAITSTCTKSLNLSASTTRAVSPNHIQYLKNMNLGASFSVSIIHNNVLWGLITCHHSSPKNIDYKLRQATILIAKIMMSRISEKLQDQQKQLERVFEIALTKLQSEILAAPSLRKGLENGLGYLLQMTKAQGVALLVQGSIYVHGDTPEVKQIKQIHNWYQEHIKTEFFSSHEFYIEENGQPIQYPKAAGVLMAPMAQGKRLLIWFKKETPYEIQWAGNPHKNADQDAAEPVMNGLILPRKSFDIWRETIRHTAIPWIPTAVEMIRRAIDLIEHIHKNENQRSQDFSEQLNVMSKDLEFFTYAVSHDLKTPLTVIRSYAQLLLLSGKTQNEKEKLLSQRIMSGVDKMDEMLTGIMELSRLNKYEIKPKMVDIKTQMLEIITQHQLAHQYHHTEVLMQEVPPIKGDQNLLHHLFTNIIGNAFKYSARKKKPKVWISGLQKNDYTVIRIMDNGIGIPPEDQGGIYELFNRCGNASGYEGSGIGLPIVLSVLQKHRAKIWCISNLNEATVFYLMFPRN